MEYKVITPPTVEPVTLLEARMHCRADEDNGIDGTTTRYDDAQFLQIISGARAWAEKYLGLLLAPRTVEVARDAFPACPMTLPGFPVGSITSVKYIDLDGVEQTLLADQYFLDDYQNPSSIINAYNTQWPATLPVANAVKVQYVIGSTDIEPDIKNGILLLIGHLYFNRGDDYKDPNYLGPPEVRAVLQHSRTGMGI
jgi:uncharacterized phiE125 gp8 family phage protein